MMDADSMRFFPPSLVVNLHGDTGKLVMGTEKHETVTRTPMADGKPALQDCCLVAAQSYGNTLALVTSPRQATEPLTLRLLRIQDGVPLTEYPHQANRAFLLSRSGGQLARQTGASQVTVQNEEGGPPCWVSPKARCHHDVSVQLGPVWLCAQAGGQNHLIRWNSDRLSHIRSTGDMKSFLDAQLGTVLSRSIFPVVRTLHPSWSRAWYDLQRFRQAIQGRVTVVVDLYGQIIVWSRAMELLCMFFVFRDKFAAWMPDGTRYGPPSLTGGPETVGALEKIGRALRAATEVRRAGV
jgi:hypothetical protein